MPDNVTRLTMLFWKNRNANNTVRIATTFALDA